MGDVDNQIRNLPKCGKCGREWAKEVPLIYLFDTPLCGDCIIESKEKLKRIYLTEWK